MKTADIMKTNMGGLQKHVKLDEISKGILLNSNCTYYSKKYISILSMILQSDEDAYQLND